MSYNRPSRSAPLLMSRASTFNALMTSAKIAMPPGNTGVRSAPRPGSDTSSARRALISSSMMVSTAARLTPLSQSFKASATSRAVAHGARRADRTLPTAASKRRRDGPKLEPHGEPCSLEAFRAELAVAEMRSAYADTADVETFEVLRVMAFANDELGAAAADVDDEVRAVR